MWLRWPGASIRTSVATVLIMHPCISSCLWVKQISIIKMSTSFLWTLALHFCLLISVFVQLISVFWHRAKFGPTNPWLVFCGPVVAGDMVRNVRVGKEQTTTTTKGLIQYEMKWYGGFYASFVPSSFNIMRLGQNGCHFGYSIFKCIFFIEEVSITLKFCWNLFLSALVEVMAWVHASDKSLSEPLVV